MAGIARAEAPLVDLAGKLPTVAAIREGLFPDDACEELKANGFRCMGFKPAARFSLPAASFARGSAVLPDGVRRMLDRFALALHDKPVAGHAVRIEGHADATGDAQVNQALSLKRAEAARDYLVTKGVDAGLLVPVGVGSSDPLDAAQPDSPRNRRIVVLRDQPLATEPAARP